MTETMTGEALSVVTIGTRVAANASPFPNAPRRSGAGWLIGIVREIGPDGYVYVTMPATDDRPAIDIPQPFAPNRVVAHDGDLRSFYGV